MPLNKKYNAVPAPTPDDSKKFGLKNLLAGGVRGVTGLLSGLGALSGGVTFGLGNLLGAGVAGAGEGAAQMIEEGDITAPFSPVGAKRIAIEAGLGAIPLGKLFKAGKFGASALRSGIFSGTGEGLRELAREDEISPTNIAIAAGTGGVLGGGLGKLMGAGKAAAPKVPIPEPTTRGWTELTEQAAKDIEARYPINQTVPEIKPGVRRALEEEIGMPDDPFSKRFRGRPAGPEQLMKAQEEARKAQELATRELQMEQGMLQKAEKFAAERAAERTAAEEIAAAKSGKDVTEVVRESISSPIMGGKETLTRLFKKAAEEGGEEAAKAAPQRSPRIIEETLLPESQIPPTQAAVGPIPVSAAPITPEEAIAEASPLGKALGVSKAKGPKKARTPRTAGAFREAVEAITPAQEVRFVYHDPITGQPKFQIQTPSGPTDVGIEELQRQGIPVPEIPVRDDVAIRAARDAAQARLAPPAPVEAPIPVQPPVPEAPAPVAAPVEPPIEPPPSPLAAFFKTPADALGQAYRAAKADPTANPAGIRQLGIGLSKAAQEQGLPSARPVKPDTLQKFMQNELGPRVSQLTGAPPVSKITPELVEQIKGGEVAKKVAAGPQIGTAGITEAEKAAGRVPSHEMTPEEVQEQLNFIDRLKKLGGGEAGAVSPDVLSSLALGAGGALAGAALDPLGDPFVSGIAGGVAGLLAPSAAKALSDFGIDPFKVKEIAQTQGNKSTARKIFETLPHAQRFNYLMSPHGVAANAVVGPYGSVLMASLEHMLSGDPRGLEAFKRLGPANFIKEFWASQDEAAEAILAANSRWTEGDPVVGMVDKALAAPGFAMTMGDIAARRILEQAGFTAPEARTITLTSEAWSGIGRQLSNVGRGNVLGSLLFPFRRTPVNIMEQGAQRLPAIGFGIQAARENPDPLNVQALQQLMGVGAGGAGYAVGRNVDPESARNVRRYVSNLGGQYSLPVSLGFAAGQAVQRGQPAVSGVAQQAADIIPLPTVQPITEWTKFITGQGTLPQGAVPAPFRPYLVDEATSTSLGSIGSRSGLRRKF